MNENVKLLGDAVIAAVKEHVSGVIAGISSRLDALEARLKALPPGPKGDKGDSIKGEPGKDADPEMVRAEVARAVSEIPRPQNGKDADPEVIRAEVARAVAALPPPEPGKPGKDADLEVLRAEVARAVGEIPRPQNGKDADPDVIRSEVERAVAALPAPEPGKPGKDADPELVRAEVVRAVAEIPSPEVDVDAIVGRVVDMLPEPKPGKDGTSVDPMVVKAMVMEEVRLAVADLPPRKDGEPGRDAAELDILPSIDEAKSYRRGSWASHAGGLIRAARATDPVVDGDLIAAGWVVMVDGVAAVTVVQGEDPRQIEVTCALTSGVKSAVPFRIPMVIDKGVWRDGPHEKGDHVSWDGSGWIAQRDTTDKPGTSDAWRLSTKRGRDGKVSGPTPTAGAPVVRVR